MKHDLSVANPPRKRGVGGSKPLAISTEFIKALPFPNRASELADADDIFGWMIGSWEMAAVLHDANGQTHRTKGELHVAWVLERGGRFRIFSFFRVGQTGGPAVPRRETGTRRPFAPMTANDESGE